MLGDAASILTDPCLGLSTDFPWAFVFATFATLFTFCLEYFLQRYFRARLGLPQIAGASHALLFANSDAPSPCTAISKVAGCACQHPLSARSRVLCLSTFCRTLHASVGLHHLHDAPPLAVTVRALSQATAHMLLYVVELLGCQPSCGDGALAQHRRRSCSFCAIWIRVGCSLPRIQSSGWFVQIAI